MQTSRRASSIITLTTDFGTRDSYVAEMKAVLLRDAPQAVLVDVTHEVRPQDILAGSIVLERVLRAFPPRTVHLAVIDPGVGTSRAMLVVSIARQFVVCPDNGLITWAWRRLHGGKAFALPMPKSSVSNTFHGRDVFAPAAARLANGASPAKLGRPLPEPVLLDLHPADVSDVRIVYVDGFGNAVTNLPREAIADRQCTVAVAGRSIGPIRQAYADVPPGRPLVLYGSSGLLEIAVRNGSAAKKLRLKVGQRVQLKFPR